MAGKVLLIALVCALYVGMLLGRVRSRLPRVLVAAGLVCTASSLVIAVVGWLRGGLNWVADAAIIVVFAGFMLVVYQYGYRLQTQRGTLYLVSVLAVGAIAGVASSFVGR